MDCDSILQDGLLAGLRRKHSSSQGKWDLIAADFLALTGLSKSKHWFKKHAKMLRESKPTSRHENSRAHEEAATKDESASSVSSQEVRVHVLEFSRHPRMLRDALLNGESLKACRQALFESGFSPELASGAKMFVSPELFEPVLRAIRGRDFKSSHVLVSDDFCDSVTAAIRSLPSRAQVHEKSRTPLPVFESACLHCGARAHDRPITCFQCHRATYCSRACQQSDWKQHAVMCTSALPDIPLLVKWTFLSVEVPSSLWSGKASSKQTASSADVDPRKPENPRACGTACRRHLQATRSEAAITAAPASENTFMQATSSGQDAERLPSFKVGDEVVIFGLVSDAGLHLNGREGQITGQDDVSGRWCVKLASFAGDLKGTVKLLKGCNLRLLREVEPKVVSSRALSTGDDLECTFVIGDEVEITGLVSELGTSLNGRTGRIVGRNNANSRWCVKLCSPVDTKQIKGCNLRLVNTEGLGLLGEFVHYYVPFHKASPTSHGWNQIRHALVLCHAGCIVVYCNSETDAAMVDAHLRCEKDQCARCAAVTDERPIPFDRARIITLNNFGVPPPLAQYKRRAQRVFFICEEWPKSEPRGLILNVVASSLSPPYTTVKMDKEDWSIIGKPGPLPYVSVFREDYPESVHDSRANAFEKPLALMMLLQSGISFKGPATDEHAVGSNINEWHIMLGHYAGKRTYMDNKDWSWTRTPSSAFDEPDDSNETITMTVADWLDPFGDSASWRALDAIHESAFARFV
eukprot:TRINITY_DN36566_c0_g1_i1.p1 TRINITY_DN36566_c0_g1~~TRINITY_DN36566_c0_g1_i1.p1  ORF type:complete len:751 (-),score=105.40 TRINITY_DN36566_c0_g1_i1:54-2306(-)